MNLRRLPTARLLLLGVAGVVVYCEWLVYRRGAREWAPLACPGDAAAAAGCTRVLLVADPQLQGEQAAVFPLNWLFIWDSDRYVKATFREALRHVQPDVVVFLGDLMDEGSIATDEQYARYVNRIFDIFAPLCSDYLRDRQQFVRHGCYVSEPYHTRSGVSQGSILGPLFFILMINDLESQLHNSSCLLYADDLKLSMRVRGEADCALLQQDLDAVHQWSLDNKLLFNTSKCAVMSYTRAKNPVEANYRIGADVILRVYTITDLGVTFDTKLTFHDHVKALTANCFRRLGFVIRNAKDFSQSCVIQLLYSALVRSKVESSSVVWSPHESTYTLMIEKVQKAFLRFLYKKKCGYYPYLYPTSFLLGMLGFNSLEVRRDLNLAIMACRTLRGETECPHMVGEVCCLFAPNKYLRGRSHRLLAVGAARSVARQQSPLIRATTMPLYIPGDNDIGGENERVREDKIDLFNKIFLRPRKLIHKDIIFLEIDGITHVMPDVDDDMLSEFKLRIAVSHYGVASRQMQDKFHPHIYFSAHTHESRLVRHRGGMAHRQQRLLDKTLTVVFDNETVNEIFVPTCSYRMGTREIGYGAAVIEKDYTQMRYTVLWTPERFPSLLAYAAIAVLAVLLVVIKTLIRVMASSRSYYQKLQHSV
ncbi:unnamed protein product [Plutella xylostella]|uniref:(diamondback moth) hypothetical protein n=1 Tax=Plutella xylostella TaxID=51655 RepID=A0A8S4FXC4_PLUXY|nr:unnamed protein product [Plutella xylostella]